MEYPIYKLLAKGSKLCNTFTSFMKNYLYNCNIS